MNLDKLKEYGEIPIEYRHWNVEEGKFNSLVIESDNVNPDKIFHKKASYKDKSGVSLFEGDILKGYEGADYPESYYVVSLGIIELDFGYYSEVVYGWHMTNLFNNGHKEALNNYLIDLWNLTLDGNIIEDREKAVQLKAEFYIDMGVHPTLIENESQDVIDKVRELNRGVDGIDLL